MSQFRESVYNILKVECNNAYTLNGYKLNTSDKEYPHTTLKEMGLDVSCVSGVCVQIAERTGMVVTSDISRLWETIQDIEKTLEAFFTTTQVGTA